MDILLIVLLMISLISTGYFYREARMKDPDGDVIIIHQPNGHTLFSLELNEVPVDFHKKKFLVFKVVQEVDEETPNS